MKLSSIKACSFFYGEEFVQASIYPFGWFFFLQLEEIHIIGESINVKVQYRDGVIQFEGRVEEVRKALDNVNSKLEEKQKELDLPKIVAELTAQWNYCGMSGNERFLEQYDDRTNLVIETAYQAGHCEVKLVDVEGVESVIKFNEMVEYVKNEAHDKVKVIRTDLAGSAGRTANRKV